MKKTIIIKDWDNNPTVFEDVEYEIATLGANDQLFVLYDPNSPIPGATDGRPVFMINMSDIATVEIKYED